MSKFISRKVSLVFIIIIWVSSVYAQGVEGILSDSITNLRIPMSNTKMVLLKPDSTFVDSIIVYNNEIKGRTVTCFYFESPEGDYIIKCTNPDYETLYRPIHIKRYKREHDIDLGTFYLKRIYSKELMEAEAKATKIKFYFKRDTLVYNASAFITQEGFVLQDILNKMPGLTIEKDGAIYSNGRKVQVLLLNGKDFFNNDRKTLLENLPAYTIKNVQIFTKEKDSISLYTRERELEGLVMDIRLKKQYETSTMGNLDAGVGTSDHYFGRAFAMNLSRKHRLSVYMGLNDINKNENVNNGGEIYNMDDGNGTKNFYYGGANYNVDHPHGDYSLTGDMRLQASKELFEQKQINEMFFQAGNLFDISSQKQKDKNFSFQSNHTFTLFQNSPFELTIAPSFLFIKTKSILQLLNVTAKENIVDYFGDSWEDSLAITPLGQTMMNYGITRQNVHTQKPTDSYQLQLHIDKTVDLSGNDDILEFIVEGSRSGIKSDNENFYTVDYVNNIASSSLGSSLNGKKRIWNFNGNISFSHKIMRQHSLKAFAKYRYAYTYSDDLYFDLINSEAFVTDDVLPSQKEILRIIDERNTQNYTACENRYALGLGYSFGKNMHNLDITVPFYFVRSAIKFYQTDNNQTVRQSFNKPDINVTYKKWQKEQTGINYGFKYSLVHKMPDLYNLINQQNSANPMLYIYGNPNLKESTTHSINYNINWVPKVNNNHAFIVQYTYNDNIVSTAKYFDSKTGRYYLIPQNISGNQSFVTGVVNVINFAREKKISISNTLFYTYIKSVDLMGTDIMEAACENIINNNIIKEEFKISLQSKNTKYHGYMAPYITCMVSSLKNETFKQIRTFDYGIKVSGHIELPWNFRVDTELRCNFRRGYNDSELKNCETQWNLNCTKAFKRHILCSIEIVDILNQRQNVYKFVNAQGNMERIINNLKRFAMFHFIWQFNTKKKSHNELTTSIL